MYMKMIEKAFVRFIRENKATSNKPIKVLTSFDGLCCLYLLRYVVSKQSVLTLCLFLRYFFVLFFV